MAGMRSAAACGDATAPEWRDRAASWHGHVHDAPDGWRHSVSIAPTGTAMMSMTCPLGMTSLFVAHDLEETGRSIVRGMMGTTPFACIGSALDMPIGESDDRTGIVDVLLACLGDLMDIEEDAEHASVALSWEHGPKPKVSCSRTSDAVPWPEPTELTMDMIRACGVRPRLVPSTLGPALGGMLQPGPITEWPDVDGIALGTDTAVEADLSDAIARLRTMAATRRARLTLGVAPGDMIVPGTCRKSGR